MPVATFLFFCYIQLQKGGIILKISIQENKKVTDTETLPQTNTVVFWSTRIATKKEQV